MAGTDNDGRGPVLIEELLKRKCPFCGCDRVAGGNLPSDRLAPDSPSVQLVACTGCGTSESVPSGSSLNGGLPEVAYLPHQIPDGLRGWVVNWSQGRKVSLIKPWVGGGKLVDIGCGSGGFIDAWQRKFPGDRVVGLESSGRAVAAARTRGLEVVETDLAIPLPDKAQEGILYTLWHVLEHLEDPVSALLNIRENLAPEGRIVLVVPNATATERSLFGVHTVAWDPPRHRWHFTPEGLTGLVGVTGLRVLDRFNLVSDDVYDAVASLQWVLYPRVWIDPASVKGRLATGIAVMGGAPVGLLLAALSPWRQRASLGMVLAKSI